jgi:outer membrane protein TolC
LRLPIFDWGDAKTAKAEQLYRQAMNRTADLAIKATSEVHERHDAYLNNYRIARHYRDEIVPIRQRINEENMLRYNGMLISVFEILADARSQIISVDAYLNALRDFWLSDINLTASLQGTSIFNSSVQMTTNITPDTSADGGH